MLSDTDLLTELCSVPTAPFAEGRVVEWVERFVKARRRLALSRDEAGNLLIELRGRKKGLPRWVFAAHMDHPGFVARKMLDARTLEADFRGGVSAGYFAGERVRFFDDRRDIIGTVIDCTVGEERGAPVSARLRVARPPRPGAVGMWDVGAGRVRGKRFYSRVCDDLAGAAAALAMLDALLKDQPAAPTAVLLTRGEEEGFIGAMAASIRPKLLRKSDRIIAIECSSEQPHAPQGKGAIIRVGDRASTFHSGLTWFLTQQAEALAKDDPTFAYQRALMPGGVCEATVYDVYGFTAASICVALGNYHNMDRQRKKIAPEIISIADWRNMVNLFIRLAQNGDTYQPGHAALRERLVKRFDKWKAHLHNDERS